MFLPLIDRCLRQSEPVRAISDQSTLPSQQRLYFRPDAHGHGSFRPIRFRLDISGLDRLSFKITGCLKQSLAHGVTRLCCTGSDATRLEVERVLNILAQRRGTPVVFSGNVGGYIVCAPRALGVDISMPYGTLGQNQVCRPEPERQKRHRQMEGDHYRGEPVCIADATIMRSEPENDV